MPEKRNYLLGFGERLAAPVEIAAGGGPKAPPYLFEEARRRLTPMLATAAGAFDKLPEKACPNGEAVASFTLHPEYYAKSYFPAGLLRSGGLRAVGSRARRIRPEKRSREREPEEAVTTELFVAGTRSSFHRLAEELPRWQRYSTGARHLPAIERISAIGADQRVRPLTKDREMLPLEVVLHASERPGDRFILAGFEAYLRDLGLDPDLERIFFAGKLCFLRLRATALQARDVAHFSFLRVVREMPRLRTIEPILRAEGAGQRTIELPRRKVLDPNVRVAVFDGGLPETSPLTPWANALDGPGVGESTPELMWHGSTVTSALLFGPVDGTHARQPLCRVDHHRVLDQNSFDDPFELYEVLERMKAVLGQRNYEFVNLSFGPALAVDDDEVHAWTAVLDEHLSDGRTLATIAAGNTGKEPEDPVLQNWRVQVPSDCVNGLTVGASDRPDGNWARAAYSSKGPGRSPGIVKPDIVAFGGSRNEPFWVTDPDSRGNGIPVAGTSYSAPLAMRAALAVRTHFGPVLSPLAVKALLIHRADPGSNLREEYGWGLLPTDLDDLVICPDGCVRVVYQDEITAARYRRIHLPLPREALTGRVHITATFCYATPVDPEHPGNYTKSGLSIVFRPNRLRFSRDEAEHAATAPFFQPSDLYATERQLRADAHKWETCLHRRVGKHGPNLNGPVFDIHFNARSGSRDDATAEKIRYALVLSVEAPQVTDLYDRVVRTYRAQLQPLVPIVEVPIRAVRG
ncbi:MAG: S8 family peptidase [Gemmatimonadota bacterium]|nr:S8 family peptidase [Gemmatimonadota bacterium]